jgi:hypothetical protein
MDHMQLAIGYLFGSPLCQRAGQKEKRDRIATNQG